MWLTSANDLWQLAIPASYKNKSCAAARLTMCAAALYLELLIWNKYSI